MEREEKKIAFAKINFSYQFQREKMHALKPLVQFHQRRLLYRCYSYSASPQEFLSINPFESIANNKSLELHYLNKLQGFVDSGIQENLKKVLETRAKIAQSKKLYFDLGKSQSLMVFHDSVNSNN